METAPFFSGLKSLSAFNNLGEDLFPFVSAIVLDAIFIQSKTRRRFKYDPKTRAEFQVTYCRELIQLEPPLGGIRTRCACPVQDCYRAFGTFECNLRRNLRSRALTYYLSEEKAELSFHIHENNTNIVQLSLAELNYSPTYISDFLRGVNFVFAVNKHLDRCSISKEGMYLARECPRYFNR